MNRTPMLPRNPVLPSLGPSTLAAVASMVSPFDGQWCRCKVVPGWGRCVNIRWTAMSDEKRAYRKRRRADLEAETRRRITESTVDLHGTVGPSRTSISAVAQHAGVRRSTVYRHFPDEAALFEACTEHWMELNAPPDLAGWAVIEDPEERLALGLEQLYAYYRAT